MTKIFTITASRPTQSRSSDSGMRINCGSQPKNVDDKTGGVCLQGSKMCKKDEPPFDVDRSCQERERVCITYLRSLVRGANMTGHRVRRKQKARKELSPKAIEILSCVLIPDVFAAACGLLAGRTIRNKHVIRCQLSFTQGRKDGDHRRGALPRRQ